eukprot:3232133-Prymnesium_polylepis.1
MVRLPVDTEASKVRVITSYTPTASASEGAKTTRLPTAAAPLKLLSADTEASNMPVITSYTPTTLAAKGAKTTTLPTAAALLNLLSIVRLPVDVNASNVPVTT